MVLFGWLGVDEIEKWRDYLLLSLVLFVFLLLSAHFRSMNAILTRTRMIASLIIIIIITKYSEQWHDMRL